MGIEAKGARKRRDRRKNRTRRSTRWRPTTSRYLDALSFDQPCHIVLPTLYTYSTRPYHDTSRVRVGRGCDDIDQPSCWAGAVTPKPPVSTKKAKWDRQTDRADCRVACTRLKICHYHSCPLSLSHVRRNSTSVFSAENKEVDDHLFSDKKWAT